MCVNLFARLPKLLDDHYYQRAHQKLDTERYCALFNYFLWIVKVLISSERDKRGNFSRQKKNTFFQDSHCKVNRLYFNFAPFPRTRQVRWKMKDTSANKTTTKALSQKECFHSSVRSLEQFYLQRTTLTKQR